jgi:hypothetical protein
MEKSGAEFFGHNLDAIAGEAIRQKEAVDVITQLDSLFETEFAHSISLSNTLSKVAGNVGCQVSGTLFSAHKTQAELSAPYESFEHGGIKLESRLVRLTIPSSSAPDSDYIGGRIYLLCLMGENQTEPTRDNFLYGAVNTSRGEILYFSYKGDDSESPVKIAQPIEPSEQYQVVSEFRKALG